LVHLYEIAEALSARFNGDRRAKAALGIDPAAWLRCSASPTMRQFDKVDTRVKKLDA
jgi:hypothetical protein